MPLPLPLVLAGPILRRVEPDLVSVWVALSRPATVSITLWQGRTKAGAADPLLRSDPATSTSRFGERLHVAVALLRIPVGSGKILKPGQVYSYDLGITSDDTHHSLASLGLLKSVPTTNGGDATLERPHLALGYGDDFLPGFALPPERLEDLRLVYGSCRRPVNEHPDAMAWIDDLIVDGKLFEDALRRPHQLVLGGDQIYADDVWPAHLQMVNRLATALIGSRPARPDEDGGEMPLEELAVDHTRLGPDDEEPVEHPDGWAPGGVTRVPADLSRFPAGRRLPLVLRSAQMTTSDGASHLMGFGEYAALYLMVWSNACWPEEGRWPTARDVLAPAGEPPVAWMTPLVGPRLDWDRLTHADVGRKEDHEIYAGCSGLEGTARDTCVATATAKELQRRHAIRQAQLAAFVAGLPKVRRALANVPTYMMFDDHDVTDDWNLNPIWIDRVNTTSLGRTILRNGLAAYVVFQDWGNDPLRYLNERNDTGPAGDPQRLLQKIAEMFPLPSDHEPPDEDPDESTSTGAPSPPRIRRPPAAVAAALDRQFGLDLRPQPNVDGGFDAVNTPIRWHWSVAGPRHLLVGLDNRTRRSFVTRQGPPGNAAIASQAEQIPATLPEGRELLIVVAPLQVIGPAILDELIAPVSYRVFDAKGYKTLNDLPGKDEAGIAASFGLTLAQWNAKPPDERSRLRQKYKLGTRRMPGTNPDAIEAWAFDPGAFEALMQRLAGHRRVVLLSGDVHYTAANAMSYWRRGDATPARIVQFTGSGFKNVMPWYIGAVDRVLSFAQRFVRADIGAERMGWNQEDASAFTFSGGASLADVPPVLRRRLLRSPMLMPTFGWPEGTAVDPGKPPDWSWRVQPVLDLRPDSERPPPGRPRALSPDATRLEKILAERAEPGHELAAYGTLAGRHQDQFDRLRHSRQILFRANFGLVRFERAPDLVAVHEVYTALADPDAPADETPRPLPYLVQRASLEGRADEVPPERAPFRPPAF